MGKSINILAFIVAVFFLGWILLFLVYSVVTNTVLLCIVGSIVALLIFSAVFLSLQKNKLEAARREYDQIRQTYGSDARERCPHKEVQFSQQDLGVITFTNKWCKVCGKDLGPAKLKKSIFGNSWQ